MKPAAGTQLRIDGPANVWDPGCSLQVMEIPSRTGKAVSLWMESCGFVLGLCSIAFLIEYSFNQLISSQEQ